VYQHLRFRERLLASYQLAHFAGLYLLSPAALDRVTAWAVDHGDRAKCSTQEEVGDITDFVMD